MKQGNKMIKGLLACLMTMSLAACSSSENTTPTPTNLNDGTYTGRSADHQEDESGNGAGYGVVELTIKDNAITDCTFAMYELDGTVKDENYGADLSKENRLKAQKAVQSAPKYAAMLKETGKLDEVDAISGATISYEEFKEAVSDALSQASK